LFPSEASALDQPTFIFDTPSLPTVATAAALSPPLQNASDVTRRHQHQQTATSHKPAPATASHNTNGFQPPRREKGAAAHALGGSSTPAHALGQLYASTRVGGGQLYANGHVESRSDRPWKATRVRLEETWACGFVGKRVSK
jgi:hypothetical protein